MKILPFLLAFLAFLLVAACGGEKSVSKLNAEFPTPSGTFENDRVSFCNYEGRDLYMTLSYEVIEMASQSAGVDAQGKEMKLAPYKTSGWIPLQQGRCTDVSASINTSYNFIVLAAEGFTYRPRQANSNPHFHMDDNSSSVCVPAGLGQGGLTLWWIPYSSNSGVKSNNPRCQNQRAMGTSVGLEYHPGISDTIELRGGTFLADNALTKTAVEQKSESAQLREKINALKDQEKKIKKEAEDCVEGVSQLVVEKALNLKPDTAAETLSPCMSEEDKNKRKSEIEKLQAEVRAKIGSLVAALQESANATLEKLKKVYLEDNIPYQQSLDGIDLMMSPQAESLYQIAQAGFFSRLMEAYIVKFSETYAKSVRRFLLTTFAYAKSFANFGNGLLQTEEIDQDQYVDYFTAVNRAENYFGTIDTSKDPYGYPKDSPVPKAIRETVHWDILPLDTTNGSRLEEALQAWETLTDEQQLALVTTEQLGKASKAIAKGTIADAAAVRSALVRMVSQAADRARDGLGELSQCTGKRIAASDFADLYEISTGVDFCGNSKITRVGKLVSTVSLIFGTAKAWRSLADMAGLVTETRVAFEAADELIDSSKVLNLLNKETVKGYALFQQAVRKSGIPVSVQKGFRFKVGNPGKIAIMGRSMGSLDSPGVIALRDGLFVEGVKKEALEIFYFEAKSADIQAIGSLSKEAVRQWDKLIADYKDIGKLVPDEVVKTTLIYRENEVWIRKVVEQGYTILDMGNPRDLGSSLFYDMEKKIVWGE